MAFGKLSFSSSKISCVHTTAFYREPETGSSNIEIMSKLRHLSELTREFSREKYFQLFSLFKSSVREWKNFRMKKRKKMKINRFSAKYRKEKLLNLRLRKSTTQSVFSHEKVEVKKDFRQVFEEVKAQNLNPVALTAERSEPC